MLTLVLWGVSYWWMISVGFPGASANSIVLIEPAVGRFSIIISHYTPPPKNRGPAITMTSISELRAQIELSLMRNWLDDRPSFEWSTWTIPRPGGVTWRSRMISFPFWLLFLTTAAWPAGVAVRRVRRRLRENRCRGCGYDLRGSPSKVCPECGRTKPSPRADRTRERFIHCSFDKLLSVSLWVVFSVVLYWSLLVTTGRGVVGMAGPAKKSQIAMHGWLEDVFLIGLCYIGTAIVGAGTGLIAWRQKR